jgi:hypothetical protein
MDDEALYEERVRLRTRAQELVAERDTWLDEHRKSTRLGYAAGVAECRITAGD